MTVVPFRPRQPRRERRCSPNIGVLARNYFKAAICLYLAPWMWWLEFLSEGQPGEGHFD